MSLILRGDLNRRLTISEMDGNFTYLQNLILSGTASFNRDTYANWATAINNGTLPVGQFVEITDRADNGVLLYCSATNSFAIEGTGCFKNADYQGDGNYSNVDGFDVRINHQLGVWSVSKESSIDKNGDVVIWNNLHYLIIDYRSFNGTSPESNTTSYQLLNRDGYIYEWDIVIYDFKNDNIKWRIDKRGNKISLWNSNFQWGDNNVRSIQMSTYESYLTIQNNYGNITGGLSGLYSSVIITENSGNILFDLDGSSVTLNTNQNSNNIECHIEGYSSGLYTNSNSGDIRVYIFDSSYVSANANTSNIYASYQNNSQVYHDNNTGDILYAEFTNSYIHNAKNLNFRNCNFNGLGRYDSFHDFGTFSGSWINKHYSPNESTFNYNIDYTYITPLGISPSDTTWNTLTIPNELSFIGHFSINLNQPYNIMVISGNKEDLPVRLETVNYSFTIYSVGDSIIGNGGVLSNSFNTNVSNGTSPIFATDSYYSFMIYPVQYMQNSGVSSFIDIQRKTNNLSVNRVIGYGGWITQDLPVIITADVTDITYNSAVSGGTVLSEGTSPVIARGVCINTSGNPTINDGITNDGTGLGSFISNVIGMNPGTTYYLRAYATNESGTSYGNQISFQSDLCLAAGTMILLSDKTYKVIENINYEDELLVWNFDEGKFDVSKPIWIKRPQVTNKYNLLKFTDGSTLKTISQHRIFNKEKGAFTYTMTDDTPLMTTTFNSHGDEVKLISKEVVYEEVEYYNIITDKHINLFANDILTSCRLNNIYPIVDMKFVKDIRELKQIDVEDVYFNGLRLNEQNMSMEEMEIYVNNLKQMEVVFEMS